MTEPPKSQAGDRQEVFSAEERTVTPMAMFNKPHLLSASVLSNPNISESFSNSSMNAQKRFTKNAETKNENKFQDRKSN